MLELQPQPFKNSLLSLSGISAKTMEEHYKLYQAYVKKSNEIFSQLAAVDLTRANQTHSDLRELKVEYSFALGGVKNHELYFDVLGGKGDKPTGQLLADLEKDFGSYDNWLNDFKASGLAARGWVWLVYDQYLKRYFNYIGDSQNTYSIWQGIPVLALDTYEHAYFLDYGVDRKSYIEAFMSNLDWSIVEKYANVVYKN